MTQKPWLATILTTAEALPSRKEVQAAMNQVSGYETMEFQWVSEETNHYVFRTKYATLAVSLVEAHGDPTRNPASLEALKSACSRAWHWVDSAMEVSRATRQILVAVLPEDEDLEPLDVALLLTCLTVGVLKNVPSNAVYWNHSGMLHEPQSFIAHSVGMNRKAIPVELWVEFRLFLNSDLTLSIGTWGMRAFSLAELEVSHSKREPQWLLRWLFNLAHLMLENGPLDTEMEHTFGQSDRDSFTLSYGNPAQEVPRETLEEVLKVEFEATEEKH